MIPALVLGLLTRLGWTGGTPADRETFARAAATWHEFYLLAGTASVTLAGLLFVSLSFNMEHLLHDSRSHLLRFARNTLLIYVVVLLVSLILLMPGLPARVAAVQVGILGAMLGVLSLVALVRMLMHDDGLFTRRHRVRRGMVPILASVLMLMSAAGFARADSDAFYPLISSVCLMLATAVWSSWDLLVGVARARGGESRKA